MPESVRILTGDAGRDAFDEWVHSGLPEGGDISFAVKEGATKGKKPAVCISWTVVLPGGRARVQAVTTLLALRSVLATFDRVYPED